MEYSRDRGLAVEVSPGALYDTPPKGPSNTTPGNPCPSLPEPVRACLGDVIAGSLPTLPRA